MLITICATLIGVPIGVLGGTFLAEYARGKKIARIISILADIMVSVPSIVIGTFIYAVLVLPLGHFNGWAGSVALSIIMIPVVLRTTEDMLPNRLERAKQAIVDLIKGLQGDRVGLVVFAGDAYALRNNFV